MTQLDEITKALDEEFAFFKGEDDSLNGLQVEGRSEIKKIAVACDACLETFEKATEAKADFIFAHHGLFWEKDLPEKINAVWRKRLNVLFQNDVSLYAVHLPLDAHPSLGNNAVMARMLGLKNVEPCGEYHGIKIGFRGEKKTTLEGLAREAREKLGEARVFKFHDDVANVAVGSGGCGFMAKNAFDDGFDTLVTGEFKHTDYHYAKENGCNVIACGHYNTEVLGVKEVAKWLEKNFGVETVFIEAPTGL